MQAQTETFLHMSAITKSHQNFQSRLIKRENSHKIQMENQIVTNFEKWNLIECLQSFLRVKKKKISQNKFFMIYREPFEIYWEEKESEIDEKSVLFA